jgi:cell wall-associated NlpC family hydrolase
VRWIAVSVATLWVEPGSARPVDAPALGNPAHPQAWVESMTTAQKRWLVGRLETQALYGAKVFVLRTSGAWSKVAVAAQPTPRNRWGYPGWLPTTQLTRSPPATTGRTAVVSARTAWAWRTRWNGRLLRLSFDTRLPVAHVGPSAVKVVLMDGSWAFVRRRAVALHRPGTAWPVFAGTRVVNLARRFLGLEYLWAGTSAFGYDCSGFAYAVYHRLGRTLPRDADAQSRTGMAVPSRSDLRAGDLVFFRSDAGVIHHVGVYAGDGEMIHSPRTGSTVEVTSIDSEPYLSEFAGARRYATAGS